MKPVRSSERPLSPPARSQTARFPPMVSGRMRFSFSGLFSEVIALSICFFRASDSVRVLG